jgi:lysylphosphatidylglycerol synthetase-like protein (DUF2156 family)
MLCSAACVGLAATVLRQEGRSWLFMSSLIVAAVIFGFWFALIVRGVRAKRPGSVALSIVVSILWIPLCLAQITLYIAYLRRDGFSWDHLSIVAGYSLLLGAWPTTGILDFIGRRSIDRRHTLWVPREHPRPLD